MKHLPKSPDVRGFGSYRQEGAPAPQIPRWMRPAQIWESCAEVRQAWRDAGGTGEPRPEQIGWLLRWNCDHWHLQRRRDKAGMQWRTIPLNMPPL